MSLVELGRRLAAELEGRVAQNVALAPLTTYRLGGPAAICVEPAGVSDVERLGRVLRDVPDVPVLTLGRGSNTVVSDGGWAGVVLRLSPDSFSWVRARGDAALEAGAATPLPLLANWAARRALAGIEFFVAIPGSVGGSVRMNAGAHGGEVADRLERARVFDLDRLVVEDRPAGSFGFSYRRSNLTERHIVLDASFVLEPDDPAAIKARMETYRRHRAVTQPPPVQNAGSTFKNPPGDHAGRLVDAAGLKGFRVGGVRVSEKHANFFVSDETATAQNVFDLVKEVRLRVRERFGVDLEPEVRFAGRFDVVEEGA